MAPPLHNGQGRPSHCCPHGQCWPTAMAAWPALGRWRLLERPPAGLGQFPIPPRRPAHPLHSLSPATTAGRAYKCHAVAVKGPPGTTISTPGVLFLPCLAVYLPPPPPQERAPSPTVGAPRVDLCQAHPHTPTRAADRPFIQWHHLVPFHGGPPPDTPCLPACRSFTKPKGSAPPPSRAPPRPGIRSSALAVREVSAATATEVTRRQRRRAPVALLSPRRQSRPTSAASFAALARRGPSRPTPTTTRGRTAGGGPPKTRQCRRRGCRCRHCCRAEARRGRGRSRRSPRGCPTRHPWRGTRRRRRRRGGGRGASRPRPPVA